MPNINKAKINSYGNIGVNLELITNFDTQQPFKNLFYLSGEWVTTDAQGNATDEYDKLKLDANGWVKSLPPPKAPVDYVYIKTTINEQVTDYKAGQYLVLYEGQGTIFYGGDATFIKNGSTAGRALIKVKPTGQGIKIRINATDPNGQGDYIRNIRIVRKSDEKNYQSQIFNPEFVKRIDDFKVIRFMDWMETKKSFERDWTKRPNPDNYTLTNRGAPVEFMVNLANKTDSDPWFCMPHLATDSYIKKFATYVKENLEPDRKIYLEYSNEVWNPSQESYAYAVEKGQQQWSAKPARTAALDWYSKRTTEVTRLWDKVFGADKERVIGVMGGMAANIGVIKQELKYAWSPKPVTHESMGIDAIAIAPYFGYYLGIKKNQAKVQSWIDQGKGMKNLFDEITKGGLIPGGPPGGALQQSYGYMNKNQQVADEHGLQLLASEGGQSLAAFGAVKDNQDITNLFTKANRSSKMYKIYKQYMTKWFDIGGDVFLNYNDIGAYSREGNWGLLETVKQTSSPKYDAVMDLLNGT